MGDQNPYDAPQSVPPVREPQASTSEERNLAMLAHLLGGLLGFLAPLIIWLIKKDESEFIGEEAKEALNFQLTVLIAVAVSGALMFVCIGFVLLPIVIVGNLVYAILAAMTASKGQPYRYPYVIRMIT